MTENSQSTGSGIRLRQIDISKAQLDKIPVAERRLMVLVAHAANELNVLRKLFLFSVASEDETGLAGIAKNTQALTLAKLLTGKLVAFWEMFDRCYFKSKLSLEYAQVIDEETRNSIDELKKHFSKRSLLRTVRNRYSFHYSLDELDSGYSVTVDGDPLQLFVAEHEANSLYTFADTIVGRSMLECIEPGEHEKAFKALVNEASMVGNLVGTVAKNLIAFCARKHLRGEDGSIGATDVQVQSAPDSSAVTIPFFINIVES